jgi:hypothetical protein
LTDIEASRWAQRYDSAAVDRFIIEKIKTVPHLEALLLLWSTRPKPWNAHELAPRLYVDSETAGLILTDLYGEGLVTDSGGVPKQYRCNPGLLELLKALETAYRTDLIRISKLIHSKPSSAVREFARAFRFKKERES